MSGVSLRAVVPKNLPNLHSEYIRTRLSEALESTMNAVEADYHRIVDNWDHQPAVQREGPRVEGGALVGRVFIDDEVYTYVTAGTRPHLITPRVIGRAQLIFRTGYKARTRPGSILSGPKSWSGPWVGAFAVHHPGTEARKFENLIANKERRKLPAFMKEAFSLIAQRTA